MISETYSIGVWGKSCGIQHSPSPPWRISLTNPLLFSETHDVHGLHGLLIHLVILLAGDLNMAKTQEAIIIEGFQKKLLWFERRPRGTVKIPVFLFFPSLSAYWNIFSLNKWKLVQPTKYIYKHIHKKKTLKTKFTCYVHFSFKNKTIVVWYICISMTLRIKNMPSPSILFQKVCWTNITL